MKLTSKNENETKWNSPPRWPFRFSHAPPASAGPGRVLPWPFENTQSDKKGELISQKHMMNHDSAVMQTFDGQQYWEVSIAIEHFSSLGQKTLWTDNRTCCYEYFDFMKTVFNITQWQPEISPLRQILLLEYYWPPAQTRFCSWLDCRESPLGHQNMKFDVMWWLSS